MLTLADKIQRANECARMYGDGLTLQAIADRYGVTREAVRLWLNSVGMTRQHGGIAARSRLAREKRQAEIKQRKESSPRYQARLKGLEYCAHCQREKPAAEMEASMIRCRQCWCAYCRGVRQRPLPASATKMIALMEFARAHPGWTQHQIAAECGLSQSFISTVIRRGKLRDQEKS